MTPGRPWVRWAPAVAGLACVGVAAACRSALTTVLDLPAATPRAVAPVAAPAPSDLPAADTVRPPIERVRDADSVRRLLPRDPAGNIDWAAALRRRIINPRVAAPSRTVLPTGGFQFAFDFLFPGPDTTFDALFPHSTHTEWVACQQCHPRIFAYRNAALKMGDIFQGKYCGECHGKVAFPVETGCERCHSRLAMPPGRAQPDFLGTLTMARVRDDSGNARGVNVAPLPQATFPHWVHRIRFRCKACHMDLFEPRSGTALVTMEKIRAGEACGQCHDGATAFAPTVSNCQRCHVAPAGSPAAGD